MAFTNGIYNRFKANLMNKEVDLEADTIKVCLLDNTPNFTAANNVITDVIGTQYVAPEISNSSGYARATLSGKTVTQNATTSWTATNAAWTLTGTVSVYGCLIYDDTVATDDLVCMFYFGGAKTVSDGTLTIQWSGSGIITLTS